jgi:DNA-binding CsgD family transcriptional regulator
MFASTERVKLAAAWEALIAGTAKIDGCAHDDQHWSMQVTHYPERIAAPLLPGAPSTLRLRDVEILEHALLCGARKRVAVQVGLSSSSIATIMQSCFHFMGLSCLPSRVPGVVVAAAFAWHHEGSNRVSLMRGGAERRPYRQTISVPRPELALAPWVAPAEHAVITLLVEGLTYAEIAQARQTSIRTVANQIASGFRRLNVSGRAELLCLLARWGFKAPAPPAQRPPSLVPAGVRRTISRSVGPREEARTGPHSLSPSPAS